jgi:hypothetical protein
MSLLFDGDKTQYRYVYRLQNDKGEGPYHCKTVLPDNLYFKIRDDSNHPGPSCDFLESEWSSYPCTTNRKFRFGFRVKHNVIKWFGKSTLAKLKKLGFEIVKVKASKIYESISKKQVMFIPYTE